MNLKLFHFIFVLSKNTYVANIALFFSYYFVAALAVTLGYWSLFLAPKKAYSFFLLLASGGGAVLAAYLLKITFIIDRPFVTWQNIVPLVKVIGYSFPSGHAAGMAGLAAAGYFINPKLGLLLSVFAVLTGLSRIVIGVHYPSDVLGGWILGGLVGIIVIMVFNKLWI